MDVKTKLLIDELWDIPLKSKIKITLREGEMLEGILEMYPLEVPIESKYDDAIIEIDIQGKNLITTLYCSQIDNVKVLEFK